MEPVTYYYYQDTPYSVHSLESAYEDGYYYFLIAREPKEPFTQRIELIISEDMNHFYSPDYAPKSGTLQVRRQDSYKVKFDIVLSDGASLRFDYNGVY